MCIGIFPFIQVFIIPKSKSAHLHIVTQEDGSGPGRIRTRTRTPHIWDQESRSTTPQQQGYWGHWGKLGETRMSLLYSSESSPIGALRVRRSEPGLCIAHVRKKGERWKVEGEGGQQVPRTSPLQIWHITLKRPQACVRIDNENALEKKREKGGWMCDAFWSPSEFVGLFAKKFSQMLRIEKILSAMFCSF